MESGRALFAQRAWADAYAHLSEADSRTPVDAPDLERLALAAYLLGKDHESTRLWERAYQRALVGGEPGRAARCAFWLAFGLLLRGEQVLAGGWLTRARRVLDEGECDCAERGYLLLPEALRYIDSGDETAGYATAATAVELGERFADREGQTDTVGASIRRAVAERPDRAGRGGLLGAYVEIVLADGDVAAARAAAGELAALAMDLDSPLLRATAAQADGAVRLAEGGNWRGGCHDRHGAACAAPCWLSKRTGMEGCPPCADVR